MDSLTPSGYLRVSRFVERSTNEKAPARGVGVLVDVLPSKRDIKDYQQYCFGDDCNLKPALADREIGSFHGIIYLHIRKLELLSDCDSDEKKQTLIPLFKHLNYCCPKRRDFLKCLTILEKNKNFGMLPKPGGYLYRISLSDNSFCDVGLRLYSPDGLLKPLHEMLICLPAKLNDVEKVQVRRFCDEFLNVDTVFSSQEGDSYIEASLDIPSNQAEVFDCFEGVRRASEHIASISGEQALLVQEQYLQACEEVFAGSTKVEDGFIHMPISENVLGCAEDIPLSVAMTVTAKGEFEIKLKTALANNTIFEALPCFKEFFSQWAHNHGWRVEEVSHQGELIRMGTVYDQIHKDPQEFIRGLQTLQKDYEEFIQSQRDLIESALPE